MGGKAGSCPGRWTRLVWSPIIDNDSWWVQPNYFFLNPVLSWPYQNCSGRMQHFFSKLGGPRHRVVSCSCHASSDVGRQAKMIWFTLCGWRACPRPDMFKYHVEFQRFQVMAILLTPAFQFHVFTCAPHFLCNESRRHGSYWCYCPYGACHNGKTVAFLPYRVHNTRDFNFFQ